METKKYSNSKAGIEYIVPKARLLAHTPLLVAELGARTAYNSFGNSEHDAIVNFDINDNYDIDLSGDYGDGTPTSNLLNELTWVHHHHSVNEQLTMNIAFSGMGRGVLQEWARHRTFRNIIQSTRYTLSDIIYIMLAALLSSTDAITQDFNTDKAIHKFRELDILIIKTQWLFRLEVKTILRKLNRHLDYNTEDFLKNALSPDNRSYIEEMIDNKISGRSTPTFEEIYDTLKSNKVKRNAGDAFKYIVTDNFSVDGLCSVDMNNFRKFLALRDSGAAWFQMRTFAQVLFDTAPEEYKALLRKPKKESDDG